MVNRFLGVSTPRVVECLPMTVVDLSTPAAQNVVMDPLADKSK